MKVLQVCAYAAPYEGNFIKSLKSVGAALKEAGHQMIYAFPETAKDIDWCRELAKTTDVYFLPLAKARIKPSTYRAMRRIFKAHPDIEVAHSHFELYDVPVTMTAPKSVRVFWHLHDAIENIRDFKNRLGYRLQYGIFHKKSTLLSVSQKHLEYTVRLGFPSKQAFYFPNGLDTERIHIASRDINSREYDFILFGWYYEIKGVDLCIKAVQQCNAPVHVAIIGEDAIREKAMAEFGNVIGVDFIPPVADVNEVYNNCKCFLHISRAEGMSYALLEAIYAGLPVICSNIKENLFASVFPSVIMTEKENIDQIALAMEKIYQNPTVFRADVSKAREIIDKDFSIACWTKRILQAYGVNK